MSVCTVLCTCEMDSQIISGISRGVCCNTLQPGCNTPRAKSTSHTCTEFHLTRLLHARERRRGMPGQTNVVLGGIRSTMWPSSCELAFCVRPTPTMLPVEVSYPSVQRLFPFVMPGRLCTGRVLDLSGPLLRHESILFGCPGTARSSTETEVHDPIDAPGLERTVAINFPAWAPVCRQRGGVGLRLDVELALLHDSSHSQASRWRSDVVGGPKVLLCVSDVSRAIRKQV